MDIQNLSIKLKKFGEKYWETEILKRGRGTPAFDPGGQMQWSA
jgi:hypothetical protein